MSKKAIFKFSFDCGRQGELEGVFIDTQERVDILLNSDIEVYFGEVLGKHSEIYGPIDEGEIIFVSDNEEAVRVVQDHGLSSGYDPFQYPVINYESDKFEVFDDMEVGELIDLIIEHGD